MAKLMVPTSLEHSHPLLYRLAVMQTRQADADRFIRIARPEWSWSEAVTKVRGVKSDFRAAGSYSLDLAAGGAGHHVVTDDRPDRKGWMNPPRVSRAVASVPEVQNATHSRVYPKGTRRLAGANGGMLLP